MALKTMPTPTVGKKAWRLLRLAVLWARRGSAVHRLRLLKTLRRTGLGSHSHGHGMGLGLGLGGRRRGNDDRRLCYGEREFSMDETPAFRFRTPSARVLRFIPCIAPAAPDTPSVYGDDGRYFFTRGTDYRVDADCDDGETSGECGEESYDDGADEQLLLERAMMMEAGDDGDDDPGVDVRAEEFIARFHSQMKLQRQISWLQYNEMMERSLC